MTDYRDAARRLARKGFRVFKLAELRDKKPDGGISVRFIPETADWFSVSVVGEESAYSRWTDLDGESSASPIGVECGDGIFAIDVDVKNGQPGLESLERLRSEGLDTDTLTARTPSGGMHLFYSVEPGFWYSGKRGFLPGIDTRGSHQYVVGVGVEKGGKAYEWIDSDKPIKPLPAFILEKVRGRSFVRTSAADATTRSDRALDCACGSANDDWALAKARELIAAAPEAVEGAGGRGVLLALAHDLMDYGLSPDMAAHMISEHYDKGSRPVDFDWMHGQIVSLAKSRREPIGNRHPKARSSVYSAFERVKLDRYEDEGPAKESFERAWLSFKPLNDDDAVEIPDRPWIVKDLLCRGVVSMLISPPGVGKTTYVAEMAVGLATAKPDIFGFDWKMPKPAKVWVWNQEDDLNELRRRVRAARRAFEINPYSIWGSLGVASGVERPLMLVRKDEHRAPQESKEVLAIINEIRNQDIDVLIVDPFAEFHDADENDNAQMRYVVSVLRRVAQITNCAVMIVAHTRKPPQAATDGFAGSLDSLRGASSQGGAIRIAYTLSSMSGKMAKHYGVPEPKRFEYVALHAAKNNLGPQTGEALWLHKESVEVGSDQIGVLRPVKLQPRIEEEDEGEDEGEETTANDKAAALLDLAAHAASLVATLDADVLLSVAIESAPEHIPDVFFELKNRTRNIRAALASLAQSGHARMVDADVWRITFGVAEKGESADLALMSGRNGTRFLRAERK